LGYCTGPTFGDLGKISLKIVTNAHTAAAMLATAGVAPEMKVLDRRCGLKCASAGGRG